jgi:hypothetical protein
MEWRHRVKGQSEGVETRSEGVEGQSEGVETGN